MIATDPHLALLLASIIGAALGCLGGLGLGYLAWGRENCREGESRKR